MQEKAFQKQESEAQVRSVQTYAYKIMLTFGESFKEWFSETK